MKREEASSNKIKGRSEKYGVNSDDEVVCWDKLGAEQFISEFQDFITIESLIHFTNL